MTLFPTREFLLDMAKAYEKSTTAQNKAHAAAYRAEAERLYPVVPTPTAFTVSGDSIIGLDGKKFVPIGANGGIWDGPNGFTSLGKMAGHVADAKAWGWNTVRLNAPVPGGTDTMTQLVAQTVARVAEYTAAGIVCIVEYHDDALQDTPWPTSGLMIDFWTGVLSAVKGNPLVWINPMNEPVRGAGGQAYIDWCNAAYSWVRGRSSQLVVLDFPSWGQGDAAGDPAAMRTVLTGKSNVVFSWHHYGAAGTPYGATSATAAQFDTYAATLAGLPVIIGEFGCANNQATTVAGRVFAVNRAAMLWATTPVNAAKYGALAWHATGDGQNVLTLRQGSTANGVYPVWYDKTLPLSEMGARMVALTGVSGV